jgi:integrase/recombinase XerD
MTPDELDIYAQKWAASLRADGKSPNTIRVYEASVRMFTAWMRGHGHDAVTVDSARGYITSILGSGSRATANIRARALRGISAWLAAEGITAGSMLAALKAPRPHAHLVPKLSPGELEALIAACAADTSVQGLRDEAIVRFMAGTGARADETLQVNIGDIDLHRRQAVLRKTKGRDERTVPFSPETAASISRYLQAQHPRVARVCDPLWLSGRRKRLSYSGLYAALASRAASAGISGFFPHRLRHTFAAAYLAAGGSEGNLLKLAGWKNWGMLLRYTEDSRAELAAEESRRLFGLPPGPVQYASG